MYHLLIYIFIIFSLNSSIHCSYHYAGCFTQVFHETYFSSSFMEQTLCFRLCDTPIIYLQKTVCRCSGGGLMHYSRQPDKLCSIPCTKAVDRDVNGINTCGGPLTYSAYVQEKFYSLHGHLFNYQIEFRACEQWKNTNVYDTQEVRFNGIIGRSSLNKLEKCVAACLDQNATTNSIAFNGENDKCLCIMPLKPNRYYERIYNIKILPNTSCDRYCNNTFEGSTTDHKYPCGSLTDSQVWAVFDLNGSCPIDFAYIKEMKKCVYKYKNFWNSCTPPSVAFTYDGSFQWKDFLKVINRLELNDSIVTVDFDESVVVDATWKCSSLVSSSYSSSSYSWKTYLSQSRSTLYGWNSNTNTRYILENGCLRESSYSSYSHRYSYRLCVADPIGKYSLTNDDNNETYISATIPLKKLCPSNWFDLNGRCYRISEERKTIDQARNSCISASTSLGDYGVPNTPRVWIIDSYGHVLTPDDLNDSPTGQIVEYISEWQTRLGFFLLDTDPDHDNDDTDTTTTTLQTHYYDQSLEPSDSNDTNSTDHGSINEFQLVDLIASNKTNKTDSICMVVTRSVSEEKEKPILSNVHTANCSKPRHVLCETNTLIVQNFQYSCFKKPMTLDLPALISSQLTHELCLSVCQELQTKLAVLHINKCYCLNGAFPTLLNITTDFQEFQQKDCGSPCPGNSHEMCGNAETIVVFQILDSRRTFTFSRTPAEPFPKYIFDSCVQLNSFNRSITYKFTIDSPDDFHPRYCLGLCSKYEQKYALINNGECLCTNKPMKAEQDDVDILKGQICSRQCLGNYFYSCGHRNNLTIYSMYVLQPKCRHGFEVAENDQQCVYTHYSTKTASLVAARNYCQSLGSTLAKIKDMDEIQDILPESILHTRLMQQLLVVYKFRFVNDTRYYWIDRTNDSPDLNTISDRLLKPCAEMPELVDRNCIAIQYVSNPDSSGTSHERCIIESNDCSSQSAMPVCVDQHLEPKLTLVPPISDDNPAAVSIDITDDHSCGDGNNDYHLVDDYCYRIMTHEVGWIDAKSVCQRDNAMMFVPEKSVALQYVKSLFLRQTTYTSSSFAHVGVYYDYSNRTVIQYNTPDGNDLSTVPDSNAIYDLCEKTFQERYTAMMLSSSLTTMEKNQLKKQQIGCAFIDLTSSVVPVIRCDEIPCNRTATVICQRLPTLKARTFKAKREYVELPSVSDTTNLPSTVSSSSSAAAGTTTIPSNGQVSSTVVSSDDSPATADSGTEINSVGRDFAPMFFILAVAFAFILLGFISTLYNRRASLFRRSQRQNTNSVYSQLTSENEFDLN